MTAQGKITSNRLQVGTVVLTEDGSPTSRKGRETTPMEVTELGRMNPEGWGRRVRIRVTLTSLDGTKKHVSSVSPSQTWWLGSASAHWAPVVAAHIERKARHRELAEEAKRQEKVYETTEEPAPDPVATQLIPPAEETTEPSGSSIVAALERVWDLIRANHPDLPAVVIVTGSGMVGPPRWGHFRANGWTERAEKGAALDLAIGEMFVAGETLARGAAHTVETMLHEAAHVLAEVRGIKDTSRQGRWHNQRFRALAEEMGLEYPRESAHPQVGFAECLMTPGTREEYTGVIEELDRAIRLTIALPEFLATAPEGEEGYGAGEHIHHGGRKPRQPRATTTTTNNNLKAVCGCPTPRIIRASRKVLEEGDIVCGKCREPFEAEAGKFDPEGENPSDEDQQA